MRRHFLFSILACLALNLVALSTANGQAGNGELTGEIRDASEKSVPGAKVVLTEQSTNLLYESVTNDQGIYQYSDLKPGAYALTLRTAELQMVLRFEPAGVRIESLDLDLA